MFKPRKLQLSDAETKLRAKLSGARIHMFGPIPESADEFRRQMMICAESPGAASPWGPPQRQAAA